ncbi:hypothetical protein CleRT_03340 [Candidatus Coxiella mudrowiae]|uniref:Uncharacterized protein n=1 Tax=Candidatus Coxiella mudrowiae TaxID=2054173 RepID=A0ABN4HRI3_9COXI|nr:hypothetical protein CleRT_03340 [Candidatus Coxiella mudrowiae]
MDSQVIYYLIYIRRLIKYASKRFYLYSFFNRPSIIYYYSLITLLLLSYYSLITLFLVDRFFEKQPRDREFFAWACGLPVDELEFLASKFFLNIRLHLNVLSEEYEKTREEIYFYEQIYQFNRSTSLQSSSCRSDFWNPLKSRKTMPQSSPSGGKRKTSFHSFRLKINPDIVLYNTFL